VKNREDHGRPVVGSGAVGDLACGAYVTNFLHRQRGVLQIGPYRPHEWVDVLELDHGRRALEEEILWKD
jgi:hypothetical protein